MRVEVPSREYMNELSRVLSKAGIMNKTKEELGWEISHVVSIKKKFSEFGGISVEEVRTRLEEIESVFNSLMEKLKERELSFEELIDDPTVVEVLEALEKAGAIEITGDEKIKLVKEVPLEELEIEVDLPIEEVWDKIEELEEAGGKLVTEVKLVKRYYVEIMEVELEAIQKALEIAEEYTDEESLLESTISGVAKSALAQVILALVKEIRRKDELLDVLLSMEPINFEGDKATMRIYFDEDAIEDLLKELQTLGYLKVKGNRIWFY
ncbi:hypothetical protein A3L04_01855 [Thermococcus chitonophagus]|uniref:Uncharacterized protein n=1 Tax=Thermococcus chitonophagus TaxID=54262 RepID=A0A2Z2N323_9EURY|nr:hypothetical protein [Thermococcus chitonophagus]ASJ15904.1 hypothetical protein A3L04_01855 [Thermococcus chitonophagus]